MDIPNLTLEGNTMKLNKLITSIAAALSLTLSLSVVAADTIKVGVLHSLSGTMAISETTLKDNRFDDDRRAEQERGPIVAKS